MLLLNETRNSLTLKMSMFFLCFAFVSVSLFPGTYFELIHQLFASLSSMDDQEIVFFVILVYLKFIYSYFVKTHSLHEINSVERLQTAQMESV